MSINKLLCYPALLFGSVSAQGQEQRYSELRATAQAAIELSNPEGGSVDIPPTSAVDVHTSGVRLDIESVEPPPSCSSSSPADECTPALRLLDGQSCRLGGVSDAAGNEQMRCLQFLDSPHLADTLEFKQ